MDNNIKLPRPLKASLMLWTVVNHHHMEVIDRMFSIPDLERTLCQVFGVDLPEPRRGALLELYVETVLFCKKQGFKKEQTSVLLSIIKSIHEANIETPLDNKDQCLKFSEELLLLHSVRRPPFSIDLFNFVEAKCILKYINDHYMRHYKLYKYIFTPEVKLDLSLMYSEPPASEDDVKAAEQNESVQETSDGSVDLKALIEQEVNQGMKRVSEQLEERFSAPSSERRDTLNAPQPGHGDDKKTNTHTSKRHLMK